MLIGLGLFVSSDSRKPEDYASGVVMKFVSQCSMLCFREFSYCAEASMPHIVPATACDIEVLSLLRHLKRECALLTGTFHSCFT